MSCMLMRTISFETGLFRTQEKDLRNLITKRTKCLNMQMLLYFRPNKKHVFMIIKCLVLSRFSCLACREIRFPRGLCERMRLPLDTGRMETCTGYWFEASLQPEVGDLQLHSAVACASVPASEPYPTNFWTASTTGE